jgi:hypothetical protein
MIRRLARKPVGRLGVVLAGLVTSLAISGVARSADATEFWPEASIFLTTGPRTRVLLDTAYASGKESDTQSLDLAAFLDLSLKPIRRKLQLGEDWQRSRYVWARIGYDHIAQAEGQGRLQAAENRGIVSFYVKAHLPAEVWLEGRARADLRWIGSDYSTRYRFRVEANREFLLHDHPVVPYLNYEWFYDTRYDGWSRTLLSAGTEVTANKHFRYELYVSEQQDRLPRDSSLLGIGVVAKWYY